MRSSALLGIRGVRQVLPGVAGITPMGVPGGTLLGWFVVQHR